MEDGITAPWSLRIQALPLCSTYIEHGFHLHSYLMIQDGCWIAAIATMFQAGGRKTEKKQRGALFTQLSPWNILISLHKTLIFHLRELKHTQVKERLGNRVFYLGTLLYPQKKKKSRLLVTEEEDMKKI